MTLQFLAYDRTYRPNYLSYRLRIWYAALYWECRAGAQINFPESGCGLSHVTPTIFGSTVGYPSDSLASCYSVAAAAVIDATRPTTTTTPTTTANTAAISSLFVLFQGEYQHWLSVRQRGTEKERQTICEGYQQRSGGGNEDQPEDDPGRQVAVLWQHSGRHVHLSR